ncbi:MAG: cation-translocating P-type ATPase [Burkholderiaceae bacterium]|nr:cation-translocating P-type ATPase [Burkholderiaceae bacterium]
MSTNASSPHPGLTHSEAARRLEADGPNELPRAPQRTTWRIAFEVAREPMFQLLAAAVAIYLVLGDVSEAGVLFAMLGVIVATELVQERRTERVLEALHDMTSPRALVWRDGRRERLAGVDVVCGDLLELVEGDRVPADARLIESNDLLVDESLLSGESLPVAKHVGNGQAEGSSAAGPAIVYAGTMVVAGQGLAEVVATGARSEIGRIGKVLGSIAPEPTPLHRQTRQLVRWFSVLGLAVSLVVAVLYVWTHHDWLGGALAGITMAMSMLPQEFLLILTVFMAMGAWRLSQHRVLTRRSATIEALGSATVLCTDKTGTLTRNQMAVGALVRFEANRPVRWMAGDDPLPPTFHDLLHHGILASEQRPFDPMEQAFHALGARCLSPDVGWDLVHEYGLSPDLPVMSHVWRIDEGLPCRVAAKGAPESVAVLCHLPPDQREAVLAEAGRLAGLGMRVLGVAAADWGTEAWPVEQRGFDFRFLGVVGLADPLRDNVPQAVRECRQAGIRVVMITGDHPGTALAIARQAGLDGESGLLLGDQVAALSDLDLRRAVATTTVFARVAPQQKLRIVEALKANGEVVAMTGDGVNDAPSLKAAHIGIAMGGRGTDVARESASLVLLDDDFGTLVQAIRLGRRIFDNLRKAMRFVFAVHVPIAGLTLLPLMFGWPLLFTPMHIAFLEIAIDPVCSIVFEAEEEEPDVMTRPPRDPLAALFSPVLIAASLLQGALVLVAVGFFYWLLLHAGAPEGQSRAAAFVALVISNISLILVNRSSRSGWRVLLTARNRALWLTVLATLAMLSAAVGIGALRTLFKFALPLPATLAAAAVVGLGVLPLLLVQRAAGRRLAGLLGWQAD